MDTFQCICILFIGNYIYVCITKTTEPENNNFTVSDPARHRWDASLRITVINNNHNTLTKYNNNISYGQN